MTEVWINVVSEKMPAHVKKQFEALRDALNYDAVCNTMLVVEILAAGRTMRAKVPALAVCEPIQNIKYINTARNNGLGINDVSGGGYLSECGWYLRPTMYKFLMKVNKFAKDNGAVDALYQHTIDRFSPINEWLRTF